MSETRSKREQRCFLDIRDDQAGAFTSEELAGRAPDPIGSAGNDARFALKAVESDVRH